MEQNRRCDICNVEISETNWSKHIKTKKHLDAVQAVNKRTDRVQIKHCGICNVVVPENEWTNHLKSPSHKRSTKLIKDKLKEKVRSFNIRRQRNYGFIRRKRNFQNIDFETNDYTVIPLYSEPGYSEYPLIVNDFLCTEHSIVETNGE